MTISSREKYILYYKYYGILLYSVMYNYILSYEQRKD